MKREGQLIEKILRGLGSKTYSSMSASRLRGPRAMPITLGPSDDAAVIRPAGKTELVLTCDASLEGVHFRRDTHPPESIGYKSLARATSDIAAMGATPRFFLLTLGLPKSLKPSWLDGFLQGMRRAARELKVQIIGGDTTASSEIVISITVLGEIAPGSAVTRSGARPGDLIYVSGTLGRAQLGLLLALAGHARDARFRATLAPHLYPEIRTRLGSWLAQRRITTAMMDLSDGLSTDLARLCRASKTGARIYASQIPAPEFSALVLKKIRGPKLNALEMALNGGEDYELLFTVPKRLVGRLKNCPDFSALACIGEITAKKSLRLVTQDGREKNLVSGGWDPF
jgi:thiamine-monophosphate kinase